PCARALGWVLAGRVLARVAKRAIRGTLKKCRSFGAVWVRIPPRARPRAPSGREGPCGIIPRRDDVREAPRGSCPCDLGGGAAGELLQELERGRDDRRAEQPGGRADD